MLTQLDTILDCFARMDRPGLEELLSPNHTFYEVSKANFLDRLEVFWQDWRAGGEPFAALQVIAGSCCNKACQNHLGKTAYQFRSPDGRSLDLRFVLEQDSQGNYIVKDIYPCHDLLTFERMEGEQKPLAFWVYEDDKRETELPEDYPLLLHLAQQGFTDWKELTSKGPISFELLQGWLRTYENAYQSCGGWIDLGDTVWKWDDFLRTYHDVELFVSFVEEFEADLHCFALGEYRELTEEQLLPLILDIERRMELSYTVIHGTDFDIMLNSNFSQVCVNCRTPFALEGALLADIQSFRGWYHQQRAQLLVQYFALTTAERDAFLETADNPFELYQVGTMLSFHIQIRERFRKQGIFIPFRLGGEMNSTASLD